MKKIMLFSIVFVLLTVGYAIARRHHVGKGICIDEDAADLLLVERVSASLTVSPKLLQVAYSPDAQGQTQPHDENHGHTGNSIVDRYHDLRKAFAQSGQEHQTAKDIWTTCVSGKKVSVTFEFFSNRENDTIFIAAIPKPK